jgi:drug/metabolite transporter (DMT)-like permease
VTLPLALLEPPLHGTGTPTCWALAWSVLVLTLGGSSLLYLLIQRGAATRVTSLMYLVPPCTAVLAWLLFGEPHGRACWPAGACGQWAWRWSCDRRGADLRR